MLTLSLKAKPMSCTIRSSCWTVTAQYGTDLISTEHRSVLVWCLFLVNGRHKHAEHTFTLGKTSRSECENSSVSSSWILLLRLVSFRSETHMHTLRGRRGPWMCPGCLRFTFIQGSLVTHDSCSSTVSGYTTLQSKSRPQFFQQSTTLHSLLFYLSMWNELCNFFFFLICLSFWLVDSFCCLLLFLCSDISKKNDVFSV